MTAKTLTTWVLTVWLRPVGTVKTIQLITLIHKIAVLPKKAGIKKIVPGTILIIMTVRCRQAGW